VSKDNRSVVADWLMLLSGLLLVISLFLTWSQLSPAYLALADKLGTLQGVPHDPTGWQVFSAADVLLAVLAATLLGVALTGGRTARICTLVACFVALGFTIHAASVPPTNGAPSAFQPSFDVPSSVAPSPSPGAGETVAIVALIGAICGLSVSLTTD
jgi:hypothetical protein